MFRSTASRSAVSTGVSSSSRRISGRPRPGRRSARARRPTPVRPPDELASESDHRRAGVEVRADLLGLHATRDDERDVREGAAHRAHIARAADRDGEELEHTRARGTCGEDFRRREHAGHRLDAELERGRDDLRHEARTDTNRAPAAAAARTCSAETTVPAPTVPPAPSITSSAPGVSSVTSTRSIPPRRSAPTAPATSPPRWKRTIPSSDRGANMRATVPETMMHAKCQVLTVGETMALLDPLRGRRSTARNDLHAALCRRRVEFRGRAGTARRPRDLGLPSRPRQLRRHDRGGRSRRRGSTSAGCSATTHRPVSITSHATAGAPRSRTAGPAPLPAGSASATSRTRPSTACVSSI